MCLAVPAEVKSIDGVIATVDFGGVSRTANISLVEAKVGDFVIVHAGYAIEILDREEAEKTLAAVQGDARARGHGSVGHA